MFNFKGVESVPGDGAEQERLRAAMAAIDRVVDRDPEDFLGQIKESN